MTKEAVVRQFFMDLLDNLGYHVDPRREFEEEESSMILTDLFFDGKLELKWNPDLHSLMLKPELTIDFKEPRPSSPNPDTAPAHTV